MQNTDYNNQNFIGRKIKHLEMIETIIERMNRNCFQLKGWTLALVTAFIAATFNIHNPKVFLFALIPILAFWGLDSYYLQLERKYRCLYEQVRAKKHEEIDFSLDISKKINEKEREKTGDVVNTSKDFKLIKCIISPVNIIFYGMLIVTIVVSFILSNHFGLFSKLTFLQ